MLFNSFGYLLIFLPCIVVIVTLVRRFWGPIAAQASVLAASLIFYAWFKPWHLPYLLGSILCNVWLANRISNAEQPQRKRWFQLALVLNIGFLCTFKYINFFLRNALFFFHPHFLLPDLDFPLGISFFTVTQIMYLVDCYEELLPPLTLFQHATFVAFFPYVISGPLAKAKRMVHQFGNIGSATAKDWDMVARGCYLISIGLFKKVVFAFVFAKIADYGFAVRGRLSLLEAWTFGVAFTLQIYFDFSGYTDMAVGSAMLLGMQIPRNFDAPLRSKSIIEFWKRWHISLSDFINTYLYTPILMKFPRSSMLGNSVAVFIAMTIAGLWHGPSWTFVLFGMMHGVGLVVNHFWRRKKAPHVPAFLSWVLTFMLVVTAESMFRATSLHAGLKIVSELYNPLHLLGYQRLLVLHKTFDLKLFGAPLLAGIICAFYGPSSDQMERDLTPTVRRAIAFSVLTVVSWLFMGSNIPQEFLYFKF
jgi:D-alanyl-lipoteichoic acid acyltransferase DltB (MBOAT superfamily)